MTKSELEAKLAEAVAQRDEAVEIANNAAEMAGILAAEAKERHDAAVEEYECVLSYLEDRLCGHKIKSEGRKSQVLEILKSAGHISVAAIATRMGISARNVSSQMTYLRRDGHAIATDSIGRKFLE